MNWKAKPHHHSVLLQDQKHAVQLIRVLAWLSWLSLWNLSPITRTWYLNLKAFLLSPRAWRSLWLKTAHRWKSLMWRPLTQWTQRTSLARFPERNLLCRSRLLSRPPVFMLTSISRPQTESLRFLSRVQHLVWSNLLIATRRIPGCLLLILVASRSVTVPTPAVKQLKKRRQCFWAEAESSVLVIP